MHDKTVSGLSKIPNYWPVVLFALVPTGVIQLSIWSGN